MSRRIALGIATAAVLLAPAAAGAQQADQAAAATFTRWDTDGNGVLSRAEFDKGWAAQAAVARRNASERLQSRLRGQFEAIDRNDNDAIDPDEYPHLLLVRRAGASAPPLSSFDANSDGRLQFAEYLQLVRRLAKAPGAEATP